MAIKEKDYILVIVESPSKCKKIESFLGYGYKCIASYGHIRELMTQKGLSCIDTKQNYEPLFQLVSKQKKQIQLLKHNVKNATDVLLATDDDREGEAIAWHICVVCNLSIERTKRILFHEITKPALQRAVHNPTNINMNKVNAQKARQVLDLLVGFTVSPVLWKYISQSNKNSLSAGRCQTPALRLIYEREKEIETSTGKQVYTIQGYFTKHNIVYHLSNSFERETDVVDFLEQSKTHKHKMNQEKERTVIRKSPEPLTTSKIQQKASNIFHYSPKDTMRICQNLYEAGYITYMRTDSKTYSKEFLNTMKTFIQTNYNEMYIKENIDTLSLRHSSINEEKKNKKKQKQNKQAIQEAHEAIRPTNIHKKDLTKNETKITHKEINMYKLIWNHTVESCMKDATVKKFLSTISSPIKNSNYEYTAEQVIFPGWLVVQGYEKINPIYQYLKQINLSNPVNYYKIKTDFTIKERKTHYTESKVIQLLEQKGIGRPSTYSTILSKIQERGYVKRENIDGIHIDCNEYEMEENEIKINKRQKELGGEKNKMVLQPIGKVVIEFLIDKYNSLFEYDYTKQMEDELDSIERGENEWYRLCEKCHKQLNTINNDVKKEKKIKYVIDDSHTYTLARYGPVIMKKVGKKINYLRVKPNISLEDIKKMKDIDIEEITEKPNNRILGTIDEKDVILKKGKYGYFIQYDTENISLKDYHKKIDDITIEDVKQFINNTNGTEQNERNQTNKNILRVINDNISLRKSKYGMYIYYKTKQMKKPKFINIKKYEGDIQTDDIQTILEWLGDKL